MKTTGSYIVSAFRVDNDEIVVGDGDARAESGGSIGGLNVSKKSRMESGLNCTEYLEDEESVYLSRKS